MFLFSKFGVSFSVLWSERVTIGAALSSITVHGYDIICDKYSSNATHRLGRAM